MAITVPKTTENEQNRIGGGVEKKDLYLKSCPFNKQDGNYVIQKFNEIEHEVLIYLDNSGGFEGKEKDRYYINPAAILGLQIIDSFTDWVATGSLCFLYLPEGSPDSNDSFLEKIGNDRATFLKGIKKAAKENGESLGKYNIRGDGYDLLRILIIPKTKPTGSVTQKNTEEINVTKNSTQWMLSYLFSVYEIEDVNTLPEIEGMFSTYMKCLKLHFHDVRYQILQTTNLEYSTATPKDEKLVPIDGGNQGDELFTGEALRDVLNEALAKEETGGSSLFAIPCDDLENWETGSSKLFYTSPAFASAADDVDYIYNHHVSSVDLKGLSDIQTKDMSILHTTRAPAFGFLEQLCLTPLSKIFQKAGKNYDTPGDLQKEHFFVTSSTQEVPKTQKFKAPIGGPSLKPHGEIDFKNLKYGEILSYSFVDMSPEINSQSFCTTPVHTVSIKDRSFDIKFQENSVNYVRKTIAESYIGELYKQGKNNSKLFLPTIHQTKREVNVFPSFSLAEPDSVIASKSGFHDLLYTGLFHNAMICFKAYGLTFRESGTFIGIDKASGSADNDYNNKLYGQWLVVKVEHLFEAGAYINLIHAIKIHRHKELTTPFDKVLNEEDIVVSEGKNNPFKTLNPINAIPTTIRNQMVIDAIVKQAKEYGFGDPKDFTTNKEATKKLIEERLENSDLVKKSIIPLDGPKYGIVNGTKEEWTTFFLRLAQVESGFNYFMENPTDKNIGRSIGIFQISPLDGERYRTNPAGTNWSDEQVRDPRINVSTGISIVEQNLKDNTRPLADERTGKGSTPRYGIGYFASNSMRKIAAMVR